MYAQRMAELKADIAHKNRILKDRREEKEREDTINQIEKDLSNVNMRALNTAKAGVKNQTKAAVIGDQDTDDSTQKSNANRFPKPNSTPLPKQHVQILSDAKDDWESRKRCGEENEVLDELMEMIGLENVKEQFLCIKDKIDLAIRQDIDLKNERFSASLLGNPGTGKWYHAQNWTLLTYMCRQDHSSSTICKILGLCRCTSGEFCPRDNWLKPCI